MVTTELVTGRELDARIAVDVFEWERRAESWYDEEGIEGTRWIAPDGTEVTAWGWWDECDYDELDDALPHYSTDIAAAWQVVEHLDAQGYIVQLTSPDRLAKGQWRCAIDGPLQSNGQYRTFTQEADTAPLALCRAALVALGS